MSVEIFVDGAWRPKPECTMPAMPEAVIAEKAAEFRRELAEFGYDGTEDSSRIGKLARVCAEYDGGGVYRPRQRGVRLVGKTGRGKTLFFEFFRRRFNVPIVSLPLAVSDWVRCGFNGFDDCRWIPLVIDDLGREQGGLYMGNPFPLASVIRQREEAARRGILTFFTTELEDDEIAARYGAATASRINALSDVIRCNGGDRR